MSGVCGVCICCFYLLLEEEDEEGEEEGEERRRGEEEKSNNPNLKGREQPSNRAHGSNWFYDVNGFGNGLSRGRWCWQQTATQKLDALK